MKKIILFLLLGVSFQIFAQKDQVITDQFIKVREIEPFKSIVVSGPFTVHYSSGSGYGLAVSASDSVSREKIITKVTEGQLQITLTSSSWKNWGNKSNYIIYVSSPVINKIVATGAVYFDVHDQISTDDLQMVFSGSSDFSGKIIAKNINATFTGKSDFRASGKAEKLKLNMSGASDCGCTELKVENAEISASGASDVRITVNREINAHASGASDIQYAGNPVKIETRSSGASSIRKRN